MVIALSGTSIKAQEIKLEDMKTPNVPGFSLLDVSPTSIERPSNPKAFALNVVSLTSAGSTLPKNIAFEFSPYWFLRPKGETVYKYLNVQDDETTNIAAGILRKFSVSVASFFNDSLTHLLPRTNYLAFGARTNLLTIRSGKQTRNLQSALLAVSESIAEAASSSGETSGGIPDPDVIERNLNESSNYIKASKDLSQMLQAKPLFQLDAAYAFSNAYPNNTVKEERFHRSGFWMSAVLSTEATSKKDDNLDFILFGRIFRDNFLLDTTNLIFGKVQAKDLGLRVLYQYDRFSISFEHVSRHYSQSHLNSKRNVGILQYRVGENTYVYGTFGKNFGLTNNLLAIFGLNLGFGESLVKLQ